MIQEETFYGYLYPDELDGNHTPSFYLASPEEIMRFCLEHGASNREIRITDGGDMLVVHMIDNTFTYPEEWKAFNNTEIRFKLLLSMKGED